MKCIICMKEFANNDMSHEHIFPAGIGGSLVIENVCKNCNSLLGSKVDTYLTDLPPVLFFLFDNRIKVNGHFVNPFKRDLIDIYTGEKMRVSIDPKTGNLLSPERVSYPIEERIENGKHIYIVIVPLSQEHIGYEIIQKRMFRNHNINIGIKQIKQVVKKSSVPTYTPTLKYKIATHYEKALFALVKIAYEMSYYWLGEAYLTDSYARQLRRALKHQTYDKHKDFIKYILSSNDRFIKHSLTSHAAILVKRKNELYVFIDLFDIMTVGVKVSEKAQRYNYKTLNCIPYVIIDAVSKQFYNTNLVDEFTKHNKNLFDYKLMYTDKSSQDFNHVIVAAS